MFVKRKLLSLFLLCTVLGSFLGTATGISAQESVSSATVKTITQQIASLKVQRALLDARFTPESPYVQDVERKLRSLRQRLAQIQPDGNQFAVSSATKEAIKAKIVELEAERARQGTRYTSDTPIMWHLDSQLRSLKKHLQSL
jgi:uncharacterized protein involved in exopolysaccharide biosynthesis